ncbi:MAG: hypothetical protein JKY51_11420, partial [Opitutaceae bacterium]|nr:hypothetical protein [Opitutaceae bacterium]
MSHNFHTQHSPFGAFASFTVGLHNSPGGFGQSLGEPADQNIYVGYKEKNGDWKLLPFFVPQVSAEGSFVEANEFVHDVSSGEVNLIPMAETEFERSLGWASDEWTAGPIRWKIASPFTQTGHPAQMDEPTARFSFAPVLSSVLQCDNTSGSEPLEIIFGLSSPEQPWRFLEDAGKGMTGFTLGSSYGFATSPGEGIEPCQAFSLFDPKFKDSFGIHRLGNEAGFLFTVPAGEKKSFPIALGFYKEGRVTTGVESTFFYTNYFDGLDSVLAYGLAKQVDYFTLAEKRNAELDASFLSEDQKFLLAQATHSYFGSTEMLQQAGEPLWVVNEGEYRMMNTFDLTVDHLFYELAWHPWAVRDVLDLFVDRYAYRDEIRLADGSLVEGGLSFTHDMGSVNQFTPPGYSSYECAELTGCFSQMTMEQLVNWVCCAVTYAEKTGESDWLRGKEKILLDCAESMRRRDHPDAEKRDGIMKWNSSRCGSSGAEITTYDSLDVSLGQAGNNLYLAVKTLGAWLLLEKAFDQLEMKDQAVAAQESADLLATTLSGKFEEETGFFPAVFEEGNQSRIIPAVEGLVFPLYLGMTEVLSPEGRFSGLLQKLREHLRNVLVSGVCLDEVSGGWKMSSTSYNTWFSKIALSQYVVRQLFPDTMSGKAEAADAVHANW